MTKDSVTYSEAIDAIVRDVIEQARIGNIGLNSFDVRLVADLFQRAPAVVLSDVRAAYRRAGGPERKVMSGWQAGIKA